MGRGACDTAGVMTSWIVWLNRFWTLVPTPWPSSARRGHAPSPTGKAGSGRPLGGSLCFARLIRATTNAIGLPRSRELTRWQLAPLDEEPDRTGHISPAHCAVEAIDARARTRSAAAWCREQLG